MLYKSFIRPIFFLLDAERVHHFTFWLLKTICRIPFAKNILSKQFHIKDKSLERKLMGLDFPNPVGLAAGFDKNADLYQELSSLGFGFVEIGTVTPVAQSGNPKKRLFRLKSDQAIINRMGFNNKGVAYVVKQLKSKSPNIIIGGNIGKNKVTPNEEATSDYVKCFNALFDSVDYFVVNVSSPNTPNLRALQEKDQLMKLLNTLQEINHQKSKPKPILLKIAPDLTDQQLLDIIEIVQLTKIAGVIATNTTISREHLTDANQKETGGLSGLPLRERSTEVIRFLVSQRQQPFVIIGVGGIFSPEDAQQKIEAGADLIQLYSGFVYEGPTLVKRINKQIAFVQGLR